MRTGRLIVSGELGEDPQRHERIFHATLEAANSPGARVLCNCEVLTTGFDEPRVTHVVTARPTVSLVLYQQVIGRGLRGPAFGGTETCVILNCIDRVKIGPVKLAYQAFRELWRGASSEP
jgi:DNA repair protein RadD